MAMSLKICRLKMYCKIPNDKKITFIYSLNNHITGFYGFKECIFLWKKNDQYLWNFKITVDFHCLLFDLIFFTAWPKADWKNWKNLTSLIFQNWILLHNTFGPTRRILIFNDNLPQGYKLSSFIQIAPCYFYCTFHSSAFIR